MVSCELETCLASMATIGDGVATPKASISALELLLRYPPHYLERTYFKANRPLIA